MGIGLTKQLHYRIALKQLTATCNKQLHCTQPRLQKAFSSSASSSSQNRVFDPVRDPPSLHNLILLSSSSRTALITLWKTSWCRSCAAISPILQSLIESSFNANPGSPSGGQSVGYVEVELDAPEMSEMGLRYGISSVPTLMSFSRQEAQIETRVTDVNKLKDQAFLTQWIEEEARRGGAGGAGGSLFDIFKS